MTNLLKLDTGKLLALVGKLAQAGFTAEMAQTILEDASETMEIARIPVIAFKAHFDATGKKEVEDKLSLPGHYMVNVVRRPLPTKSELLAAKAFGWVSGLFDGRPWTDAYRLDKRDVPISGVGGEAVFLLKHFGTDISSESAIRWGIENRTTDAPDGYRPATALEAIDFAAKHPELQLQFSIVALGSFALGGGGDRRVAVLDRNGGGRDLDGYWFDSDWYSAFCFLFVRKTSS